MKRQRRLIAGKEASGSKTVGVISDQTSEVERLMKEFESHETHEAVYVRRYREMFQRMQNPLVKFLLEVILADEEKHHHGLVGLRRHRDCHDRRHGGPPPARHGTTRPLALTAPFAR